MKLILTNDDGIDAPGLMALESALQGLGSLIVVAPQHPQSGVGHQVTTQSPIQVDELQSGRFRVAGTPADCARIALTQIAPDAAWLLAGINEGANLGADVYTSGTVAAAREATLLGCRAIAVSQYVAKNRPIDWDLTARLVAPVLHALLSHPLKPGDLLNVNFPHLTDHHTGMEVVFCPLDTRPHGVRYRRDGGHLIYAGDYHARPRQRGRDVDVCLGGNIAVTPIPLDVTSKGLEETQP